MRSVLSSSAVQAAKRAAGSVLASRLTSSVVSSHHVAARTFATVHNANGRAVWRVDDPYTGTIYTEVPLLTEQQTQNAINLAEKTFQSFKKTPLQERIKLVQNWMNEFRAQKQQIALDLSHQMGKPLSQALGEVDGCLKRAEVLCQLAPEALKAENLPAPDKLQFKITKEPIGVVLVLAPWNYPLLCAVNATITAVLSGNSVLLKHSDRTPLIADHFEKAFRKAGAPAGLVSALHIDHDAVAKVVSHPSIKFVSFTGSVAGGKAVYSKVAESRFIDVGLELGGKDPAYVTEDADMAHAIANVVDGGMYNAGQSCCAVERVYVHASKYEEFLEGAKKLLSEYKLGDPRDEKTSLGPMAQEKAVSFLAEQVKQAKALGAKVIYGGNPTTDATGRGRFFQPTLVADATQFMSVMRDESFGPILAVNKVANDEEAIKLMNDSPYGLTASVWTQDADRATRILEQLDAGTVYMNRCDFLEPTLPWSGRKDSGKGVGLSSHGFSSFYRLKGYNMRVKTN